MIIAHSNYLTIALICIGLSVQGQVEEVEITTEKPVYKRDITARISLGTTSQVSAEFRTPFNEKMRWVMGIDLNGGDFNAQDPRVLDANSKTVHFERYHNQRTRANVRVGLERRFKKHPQLYASAHVLVGYHYYQQHISYYSDTLNENGQWVRNPNEIAFQNFTTKRSHFISAGAVLMMGWDIPVSERFIFNFNCAQTFDVGFQVGPTTIHGPNNPTINPITKPVEYPSMINSFADTRFGFGLRYLL